MDYVAKYQQYAAQAAAAYKSYTMTEEDTHECAEFLLTLKHRSVTPEPHSETQEFSKTQTRIIDDNIVPEELHNQKPGLDDQQLQMPPTLMDEQGAIGFWKTLIGDSPLVSMSDRDLVPDPLFVAMGQMKPCTLTEADRVGCYKSRPIGFTGMSCKHCGGQPGFGKYFPETVRSLAQTTTSQTILKHIGSKCRFCPPHIREAVLELQRQQIIKENSNAGRPRYGSRKIFFQRVWTRLQAAEASTEEENTPPSPINSDTDDDTRSIESMSTMSSDDFSNGRVQRATKMNSTKRKRYDLVADLNDLKSLSKRSRF